MLTLACCMACSSRAAFEGVLPLSLQLADQLLALRAGSMTPQQFATATSSGAMAAVLTKTQLPGKMVSPGMRSHLSAACHSSS